MGFGGPAAQIALMHQELVEQRRWISERRFLHALNYCMLLPGPEAQQLATYMGWLMHRTWGGIVAGALFILPGLCFLIGLSWLYIAYGDVPLVAGLFYGIKPAVTAVVVYAVHRIGSRTLKNNVLWAIAAAAFVAIFAFNVPFPAIVAGAIVVGYIGGRVAPDKFKTGGGHGSAKQSYGPAVIDDETPTPAHALFRWSKLARVLIIGAILWSVPMALLNMVYGWDHTFTQMGWFFTKAALPDLWRRVCRVALYLPGSHYQSWLAHTRPQMIDGLALGEANPGPLIMVVAFVGFVGAYVKTLFGPDMLFAAGAFAAVLVSWFTFLPSFIFILAGGPFVETTHGNLKFTAPLTAITAAVVGVILNLAVFFAYPYCGPRDLPGHLIGSLPCSSCSAAVALVRYKRNVMQVIAVSALIGLLLKTVVNV